MVDPHICKYVGGSLELVNMFLLAIRTAAACAEPCILRHNLNLETEMRTFAWGLRQLYLWRLPRWALLLKWLCLDCSLTVWRLCRLGGIWPVQLCQQNLGIFSPVGEGVLQNPIPAPNSLAAGDSFLKSCAAELATTSTTAGAMPVALRLEREGRFKRRVCVPLPGCPHSRLPRKRAQSKAEMIVFVTVVFSALTWSWNFLSWGGSDRWSSQCLAPCHQPLP